ncbi:hypothetical protein KCP76_20200 [Salmonella enterica subsp. enterica serovar Weltevreden]|nr:hypothetical protein KCP76_20200 [Salmonella enterica subsp. enterica serovar Weltevreden]
MKTLYPLPARTFMSAHGCVNFSGKSVSGWRSHRPANRIVGAKRHCRRCEFMMLQLLNRNQTRFTPPRPQPQPPSGRFLSPDLAGLLGELMTFARAIPPAPSAGCSRSPQPDGHLLKTLLPEVNGHYIPSRRPRRLTCRCICADGIWQVGRTHDSIASCSRSIFFVLAVAAKMETPATHLPPIQQPRLKPQPVPPSSAPLLTTNAASVRSPRIPTDELSPPRRRSAAAHVVTLEHPAASTQRALKPPRASREARSYPSHPR